LTTLRGTFELARAINTFTRALALDFDLDLALVVPCLNRVADLAVTVSLPLTVSGVSRAHNVDPELERSNNKSNYLGGSKWKRI